MEMTEENPSIVHDSTTRDDRLVKHVFFVGTPYFFLPYQVFGTLQMGTSTHPKLKQSPHGYFPVLSSKATAPPQ